MSESGDQGFSGTALARPALQVDSATALLDGFVDALVARVVADATSRRGGGGQGEPVEWRLLTVHEVGARLGRSERWVRQAVKDRGLPYVRLDGGALAFALDDVREWAEARRIPARDPNTPASRLQGAGNAASRNVPRTRRLVVNQKVGP